MMNKVPTNNNESFGWQNIQKGVMLLLATRGKLQALQSDSPSIRQHTLNRNGTQGVYYVKVKKGLKKEASSIT